MPTLAARVKPATGGREGRRLRRRQPEGKVEGRLIRALVQLATKRAVDIGKTGAQH